MEREYCVYRHTCPNGKVYIGITKQNPLGRWKHGLGYKYNSHFYNAIVKYGWDNITHEILYDGLTADEAAEKEIALIEKHKSTDRQYGYNVDAGGFFATLNNEGKEKIRRSMLIQWESGQRSRVRSEEARQKSSHTLKQRFANKELVRVITDEQKAKISKAHMGKPLSNEHRDKIKQSSHRKMVAQYDGNILVAVFNGVREAGRETGIDYTAIVKVTTGKKKTAGGFTWKYL